MKYIAIILIVVFFGLSLNAQVLESKNHALIFRADIAILHSELPYRKGLGVGYGFFYERWELKSFIEASRTNNSTQGRTEIESKFRLKSEIVYRLSDH